MILEFAAPDKKLKPNNKNGRHYLYSKAEKDKAYALARVLTFNALKANFEPFTLTDTLKITFVQPTKRNHDLDNSLASSKAHIDGMCSALGIDDGVFTTIVLKKEYQKGVSKMIFEL